MYAMYRGAAGLTSKIVLRASWNIFKLQRLSSDPSAQRFLHGFDPVRRLAGAKHSIPYLVEKMPGNTARVPSNCYAIAGYIS